MVSTFTRRATLARFVDNSFKELLLLQGCGGALGHYNPLKKDHGSPDDSERHVGDLGNIKVAIDGNDQSGIIEDWQIQLHGPHSIIGRAVMLHAKRDDLGRGGNAESKKTGNAGDVLRAFSCTMT